MVGYLGKGELWIFDRVARKKPFQVLICVLDSSYSQTLSCNNFGVVAMITLFECRARRPMEKHDNIEHFANQHSIERKREKIERTDRHREIKTFTDSHHHILIRH